MHLADLLQNYGYLAVCIAGIFEGETMLMLGAYAVHQGYLSMVPLIACGAAAAFISDQFYFHLARRKGAAMLAKRPKLAEHLAKVNGFVERHPVATIFGMRFAWGFRIVLPAALGLGRLNAITYAVLNAIAVCVWASVIVLFGVKITQWVHEAFGHLHYHRYDTVVIVVGVCLALVVLAVKQGRIRQ